MARRLFVESRRNDFRLNRSLHFSHFFGTFVDKQNDEIHFGMIFRNRVCNLLHEDRFTGFRRRDDQETLPLTDRIEKIEDARRNFGRNRFEVQFVIRIERRQIFKRYPRLRDARFVEVHRLYAQQRKKALTLFRRTRLPVHGVARL